MQKKSLIDKIQSASLPLHFRFSKRFSGRGRGPGEVFPRYVSSFADGRKRRCAFIVERLVVSGCLYNVKNRYFCINI